jgi:hypothetical protein
MKQHTPGSIVIGVDVGGPKKGFHAVALDSSRESSQLGCGRLGHVPAWKDQDGWMALQHTREGFGPFDAKIDGVVFNRRDRWLWNLGPSSQLALRESL